MEINVPVQGGNFKIQFLYLSYLIVPASDLSHV